ncbi:MAG: beta-lactamase family protein, partial [Gammaproteobacteria bacterium]|nr:beta-lactamase family protein [Gammaproteobacteria bacterium]
AGFYMALLQGRLLDAELLAQMQQEHAYGADKTLLTTTRFGLGCMLEQADNASASYALGVQAFGHPGAGGSLGCAAPELELSMAFVTNSLDLYVLIDPRTQWLNKQIKQCL